MWYPFAKKMLIYRMIAMKLKLSDRKVSFHIVLFYARIMDKRYKFSFVIKESRAAVGSGCVPSCQARRGAIRGKPRQTDPPLPFMGRINSIEYHGIEKHVSLHRIWDELRIFTT